MSINITITTRDGQQSFLTEDVDLKSKHNYKEGLIRMQKQINAFLTEIVDADRIGNTIKSKLVNCSINAVFQNAVVMMKVMKKI